MTRQKSLVCGNEVRALYREQAGSGVPVEQEKVKKEESELRMVGTVSSSSMASVCASPSLFTHHPAMQTSPWKQGKKEDILRCISQQPFSGEA